MKHLRALLLILFVLFIIIVAVQNYKAFSTPVRFNLDLVFFHYESSDMSLYFVAVITFLVGVLFAGLYGIFERFRLKKQIKTLLRDVKEKEKELNSLRNLPVTGEEVPTEET